MLSVMRAAGEIFEIIDIYYYKLGAAGKIFLKSKAPFPYNLLNLPQILIQFPRNLALILRPPFASKNFQCQTPTPPHFLSPPFP